MLSRPGARAELPRAHPAGRVRPLDESDLPQVVSLYREVFGDPEHLSPRELAGWLEAILCRHPWHDDELPSLVWETDDGRITGCLGVQPRTMSLGGRPIRAVVTHTFMVAPGSRATLTGVALARSLLNGRQDLCIAEGVGASRRLMEGLGGSVSLLHSLRWTRPLRPARYLLSYFERRGLPAAAGRALAPLCAAADALTPAALGALPCPPGNRLTRAPLDSGSWKAGLDDLARLRALRPGYDAAALRWLNALLDRRRGLGTLRRMVVRDREGKAAGWFVYYLRRGGVSEVVQLASDPGATGEVLDHLFEDARQGGSVAVRGALDPPHFTALVKKGCVFHHDGDRWFVFHSRRPGVIDAILRGDAFISRLEGEWCLVL